MGFVMELVKAKREIAELEAKVTELEEELAPAPKPDIQLLSVSSDQALAEMVQLNLKPMYPCLLDAGQPYYYTDDEGWAEVFHYIYLVFKMPPWVAARMDCEDFSILLKGLVSALFGLNYFALTIGDIPVGRHGFGFFRTPSGQLIIEPQTADFFAWGDRYYEPDYYLM